MAEIWNVTNRQYHADHGRVGASMLNLALKSIPKYKRYYIDDPPLLRPTTEAKLLGAVVHCLGLQPDSFDVEFCVRPDVNGRTAEGKKKLAEFRAASFGKQEIKPETHEQAKNIVNALLADPLVHDLLDGAIMERAIVWHEFGMAFKCRPDAFIPRPELDSDLILDIKTTDDASPDHWTSGSAWNPIRQYGYDLQAAHYCRGVSALTGRPCTFGIAAIEKEDPYDLCVYDLSSKDVDGASWVAAGDRARTAAIGAIRLAEIVGWKSPHHGQVIPTVPSRWDFE